MNKKTIAKWMNTTNEKINRMLEISTVWPYDDDNKIKLLAATARKYHCGVVQTLPSQTTLIKSLLYDVPDVSIGGNVGFPSGGQTTNIKAAETAELVKFGCDEIDVVINIAKLLSGKTQEVMDDLSAVIHAAEGLPVKAILECHYLDDNEIKKGCDLSILAGAAYVKTGTGWTDTGATVRIIELIKSHVGDEIAIKASGGVRGLNLLMQMYQAGARRFGVSVYHGIDILNQAQELLKE